MLHSALNFAVGFFGLPIEGQYLQSVTVEAKGRPWVAALHGAPTCPFFPAGMLGHPDMVLADGIHPNARAIAAVVEAMLPAVERMLARNPAMAGREKRCASTP